MRVIAEALRTAAIAAGATAIVFLIWIGPQALVAHTTHRLGRIVDYRFTITFLQICLLCLVAVLVRAPLHRVARGRVTANGLRAVAWFTVAVVMFSLLGGFTIVMSNPGPQVEPPFSMMLQGWTAEFGKTGVPGRLLAYVLVVPAFEELLFRGLILGFLLRRAAPWLALSISALLFAAIHANWLHAIFAGLVYGLLFLRYQSLVLCLIAHGLNNLFAATLAPLLVAYLSETGFLAPGVSHLLALQLAWLLVILASLAVFFRTLFSGAPADWFRMQPPLPGAAPS